MAARDRSVTIKGSGIQGWGIFADHSFKKGELVAEYVGEYITNSTADLRERMYEEHKIDWLSSNGAKNCGKLCKAPYKHKSYFDFMDFL